MNEETSQGIKGASSQGRAAIAMLALIGILAWFMIAITIPSAGRHTGGFGAYYTASRLLASGEITARIYDQTYFRQQVEQDSQGQTGDIFTNPPTNSLLLLPLASLSALQARLAWTLLNVPLLLGALALVVRSWARRRDLPAYAIVIILGLLFRPVIANFQYGQAYILMLFLLVMTAIAYDKRREDIGGVALALALALKMVGWTLPLILIWTRRWRFLLWTLGSGLLLVLLALPFLPIAMWQAFAQTLPQASNSPYICVTAYQTTRSLLCHVFAFTNAARAVGPPQAWQATAVLVVLALLTLVFNLRLATRSPLAGFLTMVVWGILFAPLGEQHHHVVLLLPAAWLVVQWRNGRLANRFARVSLLLALACYIIPLPYLAAPLQSGSWVYLAYPRLYGAWLVLLTIYAGFWLPDGVAVQSSPVGERQPFGA